ncbi:MAG: class II aldolase/adducin family protein [Actinomycetota bacterium]|nr:class II aldolase/adducin family protein [Actinomycetota bacterium]
MLLAAERQLLLRYAVQLVADGLAQGTAGNLSTRAGEFVAITPSGIDCGQLEASGICVVGLEGKPIEAELTPSTELPMHLGVYHQTDARAVVHTHSPYATALSTLVSEVPPIHYLLAALGGPVRVAPYATPGSAELAASVAQGLEGRSAVLLQNHGAIAVGDSVQEAYSRSMLLEWLATLYYRARLLGEPRLLSEEEIARVAEMLRGYGLGGHNDSVV